MMTVQRGKQLERYYRSYSNMQVTFNPEVIRATGLVPERIRLKCGDESWPCILHVSSLTSGKVILLRRQSMTGTLRGAKHRVSLRLSFTVSEKTEPIAFFITARVSDIHHFSQEKTHILLLDLLYTQKPPDDFIRVIGELVETKVNSQKRREERIIVTKESAKRLGLNSNEAVAVVGDVEKKKCIIRDLSFSGALLLSTALGSSPIGRQALLELPLRRLDRTIVLQGKIVRSDEVIGRPSFTALSLAFDRDNVPLEYKRLISNWLTSKSDATGKKLFLGEKIGDGLIRIGAMTRQQVDDVLNRQKHGDNRLFGEIAIELKYVDDNSIWDYLAGRIW